MFCTGNALRLKHFSTFQRTTETNRCNQLSVFAESRSDHIDKSKALKLGHLAQWLQNKNPLDSASLSDRGSSPFSFLTLWTFSAFSYNVCKRSSPCDNITLLTHKACLCALCDSCTHLLKLTHLCPRRPNTHSDCSYINKSQQPAEPFKLL